MIPQLKLFAINFSQQYNIHNYLDYIINNNILLQ